MESENITVSGIRDLLNKNWLTHDAAWFYYCLQEVGIAKTSEINLAAVRMMAFAEAKRLKRIFKIREIKTFGQLRAFIDGAIHSVMPKFMKFNIDATQFNVVSWRWPDGRCFAYQGIKQMNALDGYQCGIIPRIEVWLETLKVAYILEPEIKGCLMHQTQKCSGRFVFQFES
jgi:hypothetical protein